MLRTEIFTNPNDLDFSECMCHGPGTISALNMCDPVSGQCACKPDSVGRMCDTCRDGFYGMTENNPFGCIRKLVKLAYHIHHTSI